MKAIYTDGSGNGAYAYLIIDDDERILAMYSAKIKEENVTNNYAEYYAIREALRKFFSLYNEPVTVHSDSQLAIRQLNGEYATKDERLRVMRNEIFTIISGRDVRFEHVPRTNPYIVKCDRLCSLRL